MNMIFTHLGQTFPIRKSEWFLGAVLFLWGTILIRPDATFTLSPSYTGLLAIAGEDFWAWGCLIVGAARLIALFVNGSWVPATYRLRSITSFMSLGFWWTISYGMLTSDVATTGLAVYPPLAVLEFFCLLQTGRDQRVYQLVAEAHGG